MRFGLVMPAIVCGVLVSSQAHAQSKLAAILIGSAVGALTKTIVDATLRPNYESYRAAPIYVAPRAYQQYPATVHYSYGASDSDRTGVIYNKPCSSFDVATGRLLPCESAVAYNTSYAPGEVVQAGPARRYRHHHAHPRRYQRPVYK